MLSIGIDIGGTKVAAGVVDTEGNVLRRLVRPTPSSDARAVEDAICEVVNTLSNTGPIVSVGIGAAGWVDSQQSLVRFSPHLAWRNEPLKDRVQSRVPYPVIVDNDANAAAWAEYRFGAGREARVMVLVTLGTGIGGALVVNGSLFRGRYGMAGEFGHMTVVPDGHRCPCGNRGCWEQYASGNSLAREAQDLARAGGPQAEALLAQAGAHHPDELTGLAVGAAALAGNRVAAELVADAGDWLGRGFANLAAALDPDLFVIGGGVSANGSLLLEPARETFERNLTGRGYRPMARLVLAQLGAEAGLVGAADLARHSIVEPPGTARGFWPRRRPRRRPRRSLREFMDAGIKLQTHL